jgi:hypothetical protein
MWKTIQNLNAESDFLNAFFFCLSQFIVGLGRDFSRFVDPFVGSMQQYLQSRSSEVRANAVLSLARAAFAVRASDGLFDIAVNLAMREMNSVKDIEVAKLIGQALTYLLLANSGARETRIELFTGFATHLVETASFPNLWFAIMMQLDQIPDVSILNHALDLCVPRPDSEDVAFFADFAAFVTRHSPDLIAERLAVFAVALFGSTAGHIDRANETTRRLFAETLSAISEDEIVALCRGNERTFSRVSEQIAMKYPAKIKCKNTTVKFHSVQRE